MSIISHFKGKILDNNDQGLNHIVEIKCEENNTPVMTITLLLDDKAAIKLIKDFRLDGPTRLPHKLRGRSIEIIFE